VTQNAVYKLVTLILLFLFSFTIRFIALSQTPYANGWDGYYYIMQMYTFIENGAMRAPDYSIIYPFYIGLSYITGNYLMAFKLGSAILAAVFTGTVYFLSYHVTSSTKSKKTVGSNSFYIALFVAIFSIFSPSLTYFTSQFPKNLMGIIFLLWFIYFTDKRSIPGLLIFFVLAFLTHRMSAGLSVIILIISILKRKHIWLLVVILGIGAIAVLLLPGIIHISDIERFKETLSLGFQPLEFINYFGLSRISILWIIEVFLVFTIFLYFVIELITKRLKGIKSSKIYIQVIIILVILSLPLFEFNRAGMGFRFYLSFNILAILVFPTVLNKLSNKILFVGCLIFLGAGTISFKAYQPEEFDPPYQEYFHVVNELGTLVDKSDTKLLIAHQGLAQIIIIYSSVDATNWQPRKDNTNYDKIARVAANIPYYYYKKCLTESNLSKIEHLYKSYYLMPEEVWQQFKESVNNSNNMVLKEKFNDWYNPSKPKPQYLLKGRKKDYIQ